MDDRVDHTFVQPEERVVQLAWRGKTMKLGIVSDYDIDVRLLAKVCFISYVTGPAVKVILGRRNLPPI